VNGDATQLHQVVMNVCSNAIQAMSGTGILRVALEAADLPAERALSHGTLGPGRYVRLTIQDSGSGMAQATLARIFEPFFTTKEIGRGTDSVCRWYTPSSPMRAAHRRPEHPQARQHLYHLPGAREALSPRPARRRCRCSRQRRASTARRGRGELLAMDCRGAHAARLRTGVVLR